MMTFQIVYHFETLALTLMQMIDISNYAGGDSV